MIDPFNPTPEELLMLGYLDEITKMIDLDDEHAVKVGRRKLAYFAQCMIDGKTFTAVDTTAPRAIIKLGRMLGIKLGDIEENGKTAE